MEDIHEEQLRAGSRKSGYIYGILAFTLWGLLPVYWKMLNEISAEEILANRIIWSCVFLFLVLGARGDYGKIRESLRPVRNRWLLLAASLLVSFNWFTYIWAVNSNYVVQASLGYFINPLVVSLLSITVVKERLNRGQYAALGLAFTGVAIMTARYGQVPWVALILAVSFALYGLIKKYLQMESFMSLALETLLMTPLALAFLLYRALAGTGTMTGLPWGTWVLVCLSGVVTATPLVWFTRSTQLIKFSSVGFLQYIAPTLTLLLGIFLFREEFSPIHLLGFSFIWAALLVYTGATLRQEFGRPWRREAKAGPAA